MEVPSLTTLAARQAAQLPFSRLQRIPLEVMGEIYTQACYPRVTWSFGLGMEEEVISVDLLSSIRDVPIYRSLITVEYDDYPIWENLLTNLLDPNRIAIRSDLNSALSVEAPVLDSNEEEVSGILYLTIRGDEQEMSVTISRSDLIQLARAILVELRELVL